MFDPEVRGEGKTVIRQQMSQNGSLTPMRTLDTPLRICNFQITLESIKAPEFMDMTDQVLASVAESGVTMGNVLIYSRHTTAAIKINEMEPLLLQDLERKLLGGGDVKDWWGQWLLFVLLWGCHVFLHSVRFGLLLRC